MLKYDGIREAAVEYAAKHGLAAASRKFGASDSTIRSWCTARGIKPRRSEGSGLSPSTYKILALLQNTTRTLGDIGAEMGVTKQCVHDVLKRAKEDGMKFPTRKGLKR